MSSLRNKYSILLIPTRINIAFFPLEKILCSSGNKLSTYPMANFYPVTDHLVRDKVFKTYTYTIYTLYLSLCIGECPSNSPFLKNNVFKEWRDTRTFSNLKSTNCTLLILLIINLVTKQSLCIVSKVQREQ